MIKVYAIFAARPDLMPMLHNCLRRFLRDQHELIIINDGRGDWHEHIRHQASDCGLTCHSVQNPRRDTANYAHARTIEWLYETHVANDTDISVIMDGDIFLSRPFSLREWMAGAQLCGAKQNRKHIEYPWAGLIFLDMAMLPDRHALSFWPDKVDGVSCDVGGHAHEFIAAHPDLSVRWISQRGMTGDPFNMEVFADAFVHYGAATNWDYKNADHHARKTSALFELLDRVMEGQCLPA